MLRPTYTRAIYNVGVACKWHLSHSHDANEASLDSLAFSCRSEHWCEQGGRGAFFERAFHARGNRREEQAAVADARPSSPIYGLFARSDVGCAIVMCSLYQDRLDLADLAKENPNLDFFRSEGFEF